MKKIAVIYWSGTGNTKLMAEAIAKGAMSESTSVDLLEVGDASVTTVVDADAVAFGCPSMGDEVLEETEMEPFIESIEAEVTGKEMVLFGSYGWGDGEWMEDWTKRMESHGAKLLSESLILNEEPDTDGLGVCEALGKKLI